VRVAHHVLLVEDETLVAHVLQAALEDEGHRVTAVGDGVVALAADLLREPTATLDAVARQVGYGDGFALSAAFTRVRGVSPREHRAKGRLSAS